MSDEDSPYRYPVVPNVPRPLLEKLLRLLDVSGALGSWEPQEKTGDKWVESWPHLYDARDELCDLLGEPRRRRPERTAFVKPKP